MQCKHRHYIYTINKQAIFDNIDWLCKKRIFNRQNLLALGNGSLEQGVINMCTGKWWVYYDRNPRHSKFLTHRRLYNMGFFNFNQVGCGKCEICRTEHSKEWATKAWCENQMWKNATFYTFTYDNYNLPHDRKLRRADIQTFWKKLRYHLYKHTKKASEIDLTIENSNLEEIYSNELEDLFGQNARRKNRKPIRYLNCGEYGPKTKRPHYHAVIWNLKPADLRRYSKDRRGYWLYTSKKINKIWGKGFVIIGYATTETAAYVARYCTKKASRTNEELEKMKRKKQLEFIGASSLGFIGYFYWIKNKDKIKENGGIIMKNRGKTFLAKLPKAMEKKWKNENEEEYEEYDYWKCKIGQTNWEKILEKTDLSEEEYITRTYETRLKKLALLRRNKGDSQGA